MKKTAINYFTVKLRIALPLVCMTFLLQNGIIAAEARPNEPGPWPSVQVNTYTGNLFYQRNDLIIPTRGEIPLDIYFSYNSLKHQHDKGYGHGWSFSFGIYYKPVGDDIVIFREDGQEDVFVWDGANYLPPTGVYDELTEYAADQFLLKTKYGIKYYFNDNSHKHLTSIVDRNNNTITLSYTAGRPTTITDPAGRMLNLSWVGDHLSSLTDPNTSPGRVIAFQYDGSWNMIQVTRPLANTWLYSYDVNGNMVSLTDPRANTVTVVYDVNEAVASISCASVNYSKTFAYDNCDNTTTVSQPVSGFTRQTIYTFDLSGKVIGIHYPGGGSVSYAWDNQDNLVTYTNELGDIMSYAYDPKGNLIGLTDFMGNPETYTYESIFNQVTGYINKNGAPVTYTYDGFGNRLATIDCGGLMESYTNDPQGNRTSVTNRRGFTTTYNYDAHGNVVQVTDPLSFFDVYTYDAIGNMLTHTDKRGKTTTYTYDLLDRRTMVLDAEGYTSSYNYDGNGNLLSETNQNANTTTYSYDALNRLVSTTDANSNTTGYSYDEAGNLLTETNARGCVTTYTYNSKDRKTSMTDALNYSENYSYDPVGNLISSTDKAGNMTSYEYDALGRITKITWPDSFFDVFTYLPEGQKTGHTNKNGATTTYTYDCHGRATVVSHPLGISESYSYDPVGNVLSHANKNGYTTTYTYDAIDRIIQVTDPTSASESYTYDGVGNVVARTDKRGAVTTHSYDNINRKTSTAFPMGYSEQYVYDGVGNMIQKADKKGQVTTYSYDNLGRLISATTAMGFTESYTYDEVGNQLTFTDKNGNTTTHLYDCMNQNTSIINALGFQEIFTYFPDGKLATRVDQKGGLTSWTYNCCHPVSKTDPLGHTEYYSYDPAGNRTSMTDRNGNVTLTMYDQMNRLFQEILPGNKVTLITYDGEGNITSRKDANNNIITYSYSPRNELTGVNYPDLTSKTYTCDGNGNLLSASQTGGIGDITTYSYDALNRLTVETTNFGLFNKTINYGYDQNDNLTTVGSETGTVTYGHDADNRLVQISDQVGMITGMEYDNNGNQTAVHYPNGVSTYSVYDALNQVVSVTTTDVPPPPASQPGELKIKPGAGKILNPLFVTDYAVTYIYEPESGPGLGPEEPVIIEITNFGTNVPMDDVMVSFSVNEMPIASEILYIPVPPGGGTAIYTFFQPADLSIPGQEYLIQACVTALGDENPINDCMMKVVLHEGGGGGGIFQSFNYGYDQVGNLIWEEHQDGTTINYGYNLRNELMSQVTMPANELVTYTYTPTGQRQSKSVNGNPSFYDYNERDVLVLAGGSLYTSDNNGNRLSILSPDGDITSYLYGFDDELRQVNMPDGQTLVYQYSATGVMILREETGIPTYYHNLGRTLLNEFNTAGTPVVHHNPGISITQGPQKGFHYYDGFGSATLQMDPVKTILATSTFDPFGVSTTSSGAWINNEVIFQNSIRDENPGLYQVSPGAFVDFLTDTSTNPKKEEKTKPEVTEPEAKKEVKEKDPKAKAEKKKQKCCGVKRFAVKWTESPDFATGTMARIDVEIEFKKDDSHDPACCKYCQTVQTIWSVKSGPWKGQKDDTSPMHDDKYTRGTVVGGKVINSDDDDGNVDLGDPGFKTNDNPGWDSIPADNDIDYKFTAKQEVTEGCESPCSTGTTVATRGPHTVHISGKVKRNNNGTLPRTFE